MNILGIDPSTKSTGWCVMDENEVIINEGVIGGLADDPKSFHDLYTKLSEIIEQHSVKMVRCETQFIGPNRQTSIKLIRPTGVILAIAGRYSLPFDFVAPAEWRKIIHVVKKKQSKRDTYNLIDSLYGDVITLKSFNKDNDRTDAIGVALSLVKDNANHDRLEA